MRSFEQIMDIAIARKGSREAVLGSVPEVATPDTVAAIPDEDWLRTMSKGIFATGLNLSVIRAKWPGIEEAFDGFAIGPNALMSEDRFDALLKDTRVIRSAPKIRSVQQNAAFIQEITAQHGSFGRHIADWPDEDFSGLLLWLKKEGARLGGATGAYVLRHLGRDGYILTPSVVARLQGEGVIDTTPGSQKTMRAVQQAFDAWRAESGLSLTAISRVLAQTVD